MYDSGSSHSSDRRHSRYGYGPEYADPDVPVYRSASRHSPRSSSRHPKRSQSVGRYNSSHKTRPRSGTTSDYHSGGPVQSYYPESPKSRGRSSTLKDLFKGLSSDDHSSRERERHRSDSNSSDHEFSATMLGGAVGGLAGRKFGHTVSGAVVGALAGNLVEHELTKEKEHNKHRHHHHHHHHSPHRHQSSHHNHYQSPRSSRYLAPEDASAKYGYAWGYDDEDYARSKRDHRHRSSSDASRRSNLSYTKHPSAIRY